MDTIEQLYREHARAVFALLLSRTRDRTLAEDLMQETFIKATRSLAGFRGGNPRSWLFTIARSVMIDDARRRSAVPVDEIEIEAPAGSDVAERDAIGRALDALTDPQRRALLLVDHGGLSYDEAAAELGISTGALRTLLHRARLSFRTTYQETS